MIHKSYICTYYRKVKLLIIYDDNDFFNKRNRWIERHVNMGGLS